MTPSETLSRAADLIRDTAAAATPGPWEMSRPRPDGEVDELIEWKFGGPLALARAVLGEKEDTDG